VRPQTMILATACLLAPAAAAGGYDELRAAAVKRCEAIDPQAYQTGMIFNSEGYRSVYLRSACLQEAAAAYRDASLCAQVRERRSFLFSSWGYSPERCRRLVADGIAADRKALEEIKSRYAKSAVRLRDFRIERNGNGRDYDIIPSFDAGEAGSYTLRFEISDAAAPAGRALLASSGFRLDGTDDIRIYVRRSDIGERFPRFEAGRRYRVRAMLTLDVGNGGQGGWWSDAFVESVFPAAERTLALERDTAF
jgi:hypothetical protein